MKLLDHFTQSEFVKNIIKLATGTSVGQLVSIFCAPILYRIYGKADYGTLGLFMATTGVIGVFSTFQFLETIIIEKDDKKVLIAFDLNRLSNYVVSTLVGLGCIVILLLMKDIAFVQSLGNYILLIPISVFFQGQNEILKTFANRSKNYNSILKNTIIISVLTPLLSIFIGIISNGPIGLFISLVFSQIAAYFYLNYNLFNFKFSYNRLFLTHKEIFLYAKNQFDFPKYILPTYFLGRISKQLPIFFLNRYFSIESVGLYNLTQRILGLPSQFLTNSISIVFRQKISEKINKKDNALSLFDGTAKGLLYISLAPLIIVMLFGPDLFAFVFGNEWIESGSLSRIFIWLFTFQMVVSPLSYIFIIKRKLREALFVHIYLFFSTILILYISKIYFELSMSNSLMLYVLNYCLFYSYYYFRSRQLIK